MRRRSMSLLTSLFVLAGLIGPGATIVMAGAMAVITVTEAPAEPPAGQETTIGFEVMQHGVKPVSWPRITVVATDAATGTVVQAEAKAEGPTGSYVATVVFPTAGDWKLTFESTDLYLEGSTVLRVVSGVAAPAAVTPEAPVTTSTGGSAQDMTMAVIALVIGLLMLGVALALRSRRDRDQTPVTART